MKNNSRAKVISPKEIGRLRYPLPRSWIEAAGILKGKKRIDPLRYQRQIRKEWEDRFQELVKELRKPRS